MVTAAYAADHVVWSRVPFSVERAAVASTWLAEALRTGFIQVSEKPLPLAVNDVPERALPRSRCTKPVSLASAVDRFRV